MSTAREVVPIYPLTTATWTGDAHRARLAPLTPPATSPLYAWGVAPGGLSAIGNQTAPPAAPPPPDPSTPPAAGGSDCGCS